MFTGQLSLIRREFAPCLGQVFCKSEVPTQTPKTAIRRKLGGSFLGRVLLAPLLPWQRRKSSIAGRMQSRRNQAGQPPAAGQRSLHPLPCQVYGPTAGRPRQISARPGQIESKNADQVEPDRRSRRSLRLPAYVLIRSRLYSGRAPTQPTKCLHWFISSDAQ